MPFTDLETILLAETFFTTQSSFCSENGSVKLVCLTLVILFPICPPSFEKKIFFFFLLYWSTDVNFCCKNFTFLFLFFRVDDLICVDHAAGWQFGVDEWSIQHRKTGRPEIENTPKTKHARRGRKVLAWSGRWIWTVDISTVG